MLGQQCKRESPRLFQSHLPEKKSGCRSNQLCPRSFLSHSRIGRVTLANATQAFSRSDVPDLYTEAFRLSRVDWVSWIRIPSNRRVHSLRRYGMNQDLLAPLSSDEEVAGYPVRLSRLATSFLPDLNHGSLTVPAIEDDARRNTFRIRMVGYFIKQSDEDTREIIEIVASDSKCRFIERICEEFQKGHRFGKPVRCDSKLDLTRIGPSWGDRDLQCPEIADALQNPLSMTAYLMRRPGGHRRRLIELVLEFFVER